VTEISHQPDDRLELYALGRLPEPEVTVVEEHLLVCLSCRQRLDEVELFAVAMRQAISSEPPARERPMWFAWLRQQLSPRLSPRLIGAVGFAAIMLTTFLYLHPGRKVDALASLDLAAMRGDVQQVSPAQETDITLTDAPGQRGLRAEVVDYKGVNVWSAGSSTVRIKKQLPSGSYFVRLFDQSGKLLHEYGFNVRAAPL
jgi:anti-sigma factor RsiW